MLTSLTITSVTLGVAARNGQIAATVNELAAESVNAVEVDPQRAMLLALEALALSDGDSIPALRSLRLSLSQHRLVALTELPNDLPRAQGIGLALHEGRNEIAITPDGSTILFADASSLEVNRQVVINTQVRPPTGGFPDLDFSPDGSLLATVDTAGRVNVVDVETASLAWSADVAVVGPGIAKFSADGRLIAFAGYAEPENLFAPMTVGVIDVESREALWTAGIVTPNDLEFADGGTTLVVGTWASNLAEFSGEIIVFNSETGEERIRRTATLDNLASVVIDQQRRRVWESGAAGLIRIRELDTLDVVAEIRTDESVLDLSINTTNSVVVSGSQPATAWDAAHFSEIARLGGGDSKYGASAVSADGSTLYVADVATETLEKYRLDAAGPGELFSVGVDLEPFGVEVTPDGSLIAVSSIPAGVIHTFDLRSGDQVDRTDGIHRFPFGGVSFSSDGAMVVAQHQNGVASSSLFLAPDLSAPPVVVFEDTSFAGVMTPTLFRDNEFLAGGIGTLVRTWDASTGRLEREFDLGAIVGAVAVDGDGELLVAGSCVTNEVMVFDLPSLEPMQSVELPGCQSRVDISSDGSKFAAASQDAGVGVWRTSDGMSLVRTTEPAFSVEFSPDGTRVAVGRLDGVVQEFDVSTGSLIEEWAVGRGGAAEVTYLPDGRSLAVAYIGGAIRVFTLDRAELIELAQARLFRTWTQEECELFRIDSCAGS